MTKRLIYLIGFFSIIFQSVFAQSETKAVKIVDDFIKSVQDNTVKTNFTLSVYDDDNDLLQSMAGTLYMNKNRFALDTEEIKVFFDGKTQWSYMAASNEVSITEPSENELAQINPMSIIADYRKNSFIIFSKKEKSAENDVIIMIPTIPGVDLEDITIQINKTTSNLSSVKMSETNGNTIQIKFSNFQKGVTIPDNAFVFDKNKYKDVFENDMR